MHEPAVARCGLLDALHCIPHSVLFDFDLEIGGLYDGLAERRNTATTLEGCAPA